ncbi:exodeoxyribonuclease V alpha subunit [Pullulanibacillus pueri]|uniref:ATP-dependent RecD2 DNA helicase n=1 Tax=Pullulanibacillus pueri TaxID=1437324 RepID=A0A8J2ZYS8_9BACL|nr:ATP-dependent RecD-like DNA helicase [Pullulanibacillus pueri]MBM7683246.1 exodeoxyribonuclease V alpha subunit [Pullulanibacillus pueri]GGH85717.1 ATP-dependent RecD-like DNA helicase [Pullulanibacillus pueri]
MMESMDLFAEEKKYVKGIPHHIVFRNEENGYTVLRIRVEETNEAIEDKDIALFGFFPVIHLHESYQFFGKIKMHPKYGQQYEVEQFRKLLPQSKDGVVQYLSGELFPGIGKSTAERIVAHLGETAITQILNQPQCLSDVPKLPEDKALQIAETLMAHEGLEKVMIALSDYGFGTQLSTKIYQAYGNDAVRIIEENPYRLVQDIEGIGFHRADEIGKRLGLVGNHPERIQAGCLYWLNEKAQNEGHVFMTFAETVDGVQELLSTKQAEVDVGSIENELDVLEEKGQLIIEELNVYLPSLYFAEKGLVTSIKKLSEQTDFENEFSESEFLEALGALEERLNIQYAPSQKEAIQTAIHSPIMLLTGGPGTGKTTVIKGIVEIVAELRGFSLNPKDYKDKEESFPFLLAAPTGRAAKRMSESTGLPAVTIHRLLGWRGGSGYDHDEEHPIEGKLLIIDEMSMVDLWLANQLFKSLPLPMQVIVVGDEDQLPSVGPGQVLNDFLHSEVIPTVRLTDIYRQSEDSSIIELAHEIKQGRLPETIGQQTGDRSFFNCHQNQVVDVVCQVCNNAIKKGFTAMDIQVLVPIYRGSAGIDAMNTALQNLFNPESDSKRTLTFGDKLFRTGDKVLQLVNNPDEGVFNGDIGEVVAIFRAKETTEKEDQLVVSFDGKEIVYLKRDLNQLTLAYCCSIHKSQGSEFPIVVLPIVKGYHRMLKRNLVYTAITRSKSFLILCGDIKALEYSIEQTHVDRRNSMLKEKLIERLGTEALALSELSIEDFEEEV